MNGYDVERLAQYNSERSRGLVHTPEWQAEMARMQKRWDAEHRPGVFISHEQTKRRWRRTKATP